MSNSFLRIRVGMGYDVHKLVEGRDKVGNIDATVCAEKPKINPHIPAMKVCMAEIIGCDEDDISIKATTSERMGFVGREEGMAAYAVCLISKY